MREPVKFTGFIILSNYYLKMLKMHVLLKWQDYLNSVENTSVSEPNILQLTVLTCPKRL